MSQSQILIKQTTPDFIKFLLHQLAAQLQQQFKYKLLLHRAAGFY